MSTTEFNQLSKDIAEELCFNCSAISLSGSPDYIELFDWLVKYVGLSDNPKLEIPIQTDIEKNIGRCDDYYCRTFMYPTESESNHNTFMDSVLGFDDKLIVNTCRRIGTARKLTEAQAEIFICSAAYTQGHDQTLKNYLARFFQKYRRKGVKLNIETKYQSVITRLIEKELPLQPTNSINLVIQEDLIRLENQEASIVPFIPDNSKNYRYEEPSSLLRWDSRITDIIGREDELDELHKWLESTSAASVSCKIIAGASGTGKSRLAAEFALSIRGEDWSAGFLKFGSKQHYGTWQCGKKGLLLIVDYPEQQASQLDTIMSQLISLDTKEKRVCILLLTRNSIFVEKLSFDAKSLFHSNLYLDGISYENDNSWVLFTKAWNAINYLKSIEEENVSDCPIEKKDFNRWQEVEAHKTPLMILTLAYYISDKENKKSENIIQLDSKTLIRYLSVREARLIEKEVNDVNLTRLKRRPDIRTLSPDHIILVKALAAVPSVFNVVVYQRFIGSISNNNIRSAMPKLADLKVLSIWNKSGISCIQPDIIAADFLAYSMHLFSELMIEDLIIAVLDLQQDEKTISQDLYDRFYRFGRLVSDSNMLNDTEGEYSDEGWKWPIQRISKRVFKDSRLSKIIETLYIPNRYLPECLAWFGIHAILTRCLDAEEPHEHGFYPLVLSEIRMELSQVELALDAADRAMQIYIRLWIEDTNKYCDELLSSLIMITNIICTHGDPKEAMFYSDKIKETLRIKYLDGKNEKDLLFFECLKVHSLTLSKNGHQEQAYKILLEAHTFIINFWLKNPKDYLLYADFLNQLSNTASAINHTKEALAYSKSSVEIYSEFYKEHPHIFDNRLALGLHNLSLRQFECSHYDEALNCILKSVEIRSKLAKYESSFDRDLIISMNLQAYFLLLNGYLRDGVDIYESIENDYFTKKYPTKLLDLQRGTVDSIERAFSINSLRENRGVIECLKVIQLSIKQRLGE